MQTASALPFFLIARPKIAPFPTGHWYLQIYLTSGWNAKNCNFLGGAETPKTAMSLAKVSAFNNTLSLTSGS